MIKSFEVDHTLLIAPLIRLADIYTKGEVVIKKYDLRFLTPNTKHYDDKTMHSMEHLLATSFKMIFKDDMIDLSPMGCKTGFYFTVFKCDKELEKLFEAISKSADVEIPQPTKYNCGSYKLHNIKKARRELRRLSNELCSSSN